MIVVSGTLTFNADAMDGAVDAMTTLTTATLAEEGCVTYGYWQSPTDPGLFRVFEEWADAAAIDAHMASPHMAEFMGTIMGCGITGAEIWRYDGPEKSKLM